MHVRISCLCAIITFTSVVAFAKQISLYYSLPEAHTTAHALVVLAYGSLCLAFMCGSVYVICGRPASPWPTLRFGAAFAGIDFVLVNTFIRFVLVPAVEPDGLGFPYPPGRSEFNESLLSMGFVALLGLAATAARRERFVQWLGKGMPSNGMPPPPHQTFVSCRVVAEGEASGSAMARGDTHEPAAEATAAEVTAVGSSSQSPAALRGPKACAAIAALNSSYEGSIGAAADTLSDSGESMN